MAGAPQPTTLKELIDLLRASIRVGPDGREYVDLSGALFAEAGVFVAYLARTTLRITQSQGTQFLGGPRFQRNARYSRDVMILSGRAGGVRPGGAFVEETCRYRLCQQPVSVGGCNRTLRYHAIVS